MEDSRFGKRRRNVMYSRDEVSSNKILRHDLRYSRWWLLGLTQFGRGRNAITRSNGHGFALTVKSHMELRMQISHTLIAKSTTVTSQNLHSVEKSMGCSPWYASGRLLKPYTVHSP